jgi:predicted amidohydrolase YtcJ
MLIRNGEVDGVPASVRTDQDRIVEVGHDLDPLPGETVLDAAGGAILPGLHDHHLHLRALAASLRSVPVGPAHVRNPDEFAATLGRADRARAAGSWLRVVDYHESTVGDIDGAVLDRLAPRGPVRVQHASGALWVLNSAALRHVIDGPTPPGVERDAEGRPTGRVWREDRWLRERLPAVDVDLGEVGRLGVAMGVTGLTDATPDQGEDDLADLVLAAFDGRIPQRLHLAARLGATLPATATTTRGTAASPSGCASSGPAGRGTDAGGPVHLGPVKVMLDDDRLPGPDALADTFRAAHGIGRPVAVHCVTRVQAVLTLVSWQESGSRPGDRMEHGAVLGPAEMTALRRLGVLVVTQPGMVWDRGDRYIAEVDVADQPDLWRLGSLLDAGVAVAASTDAPYGAFDPWRAILAATRRRTRLGQLLGPGERVPVRTAVGLWAGRGDAPTTLRRVRPGHPADLCVLRSPLDRALDDDTAAPVAATVIGGDLVYGTASSPDSAR